MVRAVESKSGKVTKESTSRIADYPPDAVDVRTHRPVKLVITDDLEIVRGAAAEKTDSLVYRAAKRSLDIFGSLFGLVAFAWLFAVIAIAVRLTSPGPVIFLSRRVGYGGKEFYAYKFRTMVLNAENLVLVDENLRAVYEANFKIKNDPRVTPVGAVLRRTSMDELPQLLNVLKGEMSLIGPRPMVIQERSKWGTLGDKLVTVKPGLGGLWQVYRDGEVTLSQRMALDMEYVDKRSFGLDMKLLFLTVGTIFKNRGAY